MDRKGAIARPKSCSLCNPKPKLVTEEPSSGRSPGQRTLDHHQKKTNKELLLGLATNETRDGAQDHSPRRRRPKGRALPPRSWAPTRHHLPHVNIISGQMAVRGGRRPRSGGFEEARGRGRERRGQGASRVLRSTGTQSRAAGSRSSVDKAFARWWCNRTPVWGRICFFFLLLLLLDKRSPSLLDPENVRMK